MKKIIPGLLFLLAIAVNSQNITLSLENGEITNDGTNDFYEVDVMISSDTDYTQGSGQFFIDYNPAVFGIDIGSNGAITYERPSGSILGSQSNGVDNYNSFVINDNVSSRVSYLWQQFWSSGTIGVTNVTSTPALLVHIKIRIIDPTGDTGVCFNTTSPFDDQFFTACGPFTSTTAPANCTNDPGTQILNYTPDCSGGAVLNVPESHSNNIAIYPNPASDVLNVVSPHDDINVLTLYDISGRIVNKQRIDQTHGIIDLSALPKAIYLLEVTTQQGITIKKIVKK